MFKKSYWNEEMKSRDIYNNKLDKLKKTYKIEIQNEHHHFLKIEPVTTTKDPEKLQSESKDQNSTNSKNKYGYYQRGGYCQYNRWQNNNRQQR